MATATGTLPAGFRSLLNTDRWFYGVFQSAPELKAAGHRLDGVLWPLASEEGSEELPVVFLEVQMRADPGFHHRLAAQAYRFLQLHPRIEHWRVVVITPHRRLNLGPITPLRGFLEIVQWVSLDELGQQDPLDAAIDLLTQPAVVRSGDQLEHLGILQTQPDSKGVSNGVICNGDTLREPMLIEHGEIMQFDRVIANP